MSEFTPSERSEPRGKPPNLVRFLAAVAVAVVLGWIAYRVRAVLAPLIAGLILAYIFNPAVNALERRGWKRVWGSAAVLGGVLLAIALVVTLVVPPAVRSSVGFVTDTIPDIRSKLPQVYEKLNAFVGEEKLLEIREEVESKLADDAGAYAKAAGALLVAYVATGVESLLSAISWLVLVPIYTFFALVGMDPLWKKVQEAIPAPIRPRALKTLERVHRANAAFFRGQSTICLIKAVLAVVGYGLTGLPFWFLVGLAHGLLSFFPFVGVAATFVLVSVLGFVDVGFSWALAAPLGVLVGIEILEGFVLQPMILGKETGLHPVLVILSFMICGELFGFFGLLLAVPLFTAGLIVFKDYVVPLYTHVGDHLSAEFQDESV